MPTDEILWSPGPEARERTRIGRYQRWLDENRGVRLATYDELWRWSVDDLEGFWTSIWDHLRVAHAGPTPMRADGAPARARAPRARRTRRGTTRLSRAVASR